MILVGRTSRDWWLKADGGGLNGEEGDDDCRLGGKTDKYRTLDPVCSQEARTLQGRP